MSLSADQQKVYDKIQGWIADKQSEDWMFYLGGFAGTGKTYLLGHIINNLPAPPLCLAPTGKAASVLQKKLRDVPVSTVHSALYRPVAPDLNQLAKLEEKLLNDPQNEAIKQAVREEKARIAALPVSFSSKDYVAIRPGDLVVIDEASMVTNRMLDDLEKTKAKVLFVGDPGQLPPVGDIGYFSSQRPDVMLTEVQRQALDNPIIQLSMMIRKGEPIPKQIENDHILRRPRHGFELEKLIESDQILTGRNAIRRKLNRICRKLHGRNESIWPVAGEKLICLKNLVYGGTWFINGVQCVAVSDATLDTASYDRTVTVEYEGRTVTNVPFYHYPFEVHYHKDAQDEPWAARTGLCELDYGYAITVHKSQGSEWASVILVDDEMNIDDRSFRKRWLYTAVTRAKERLTWLCQE